MRTLKSLFTISLIAFTALSASQHDAWAKDYYLQAEPFTATIALPNGPQSVPMWGYRECDSTFTTCGSLASPGPVLDVPPGEGLTIQLKNLLPEPTSIVIPGQREDGMGAANVPYKDSNQRMRAFTHETPSGGTGTYTWTTLAPGTYLYHSGSHVQKQVPMGLYGGMKHDAGPGQAYSGLNYDKDSLLVFSEIDPAFNTAVYNGTYGQPNSIAGIDYQPKYFLINGAAYISGTSLPVNVGQTGEHILLRFINAGLKSHVPTLQNAFFHLKAEDGHPLPHGGHEQYAALLAAGKTLDAMWVPALPGTYPLYDGRLNKDMLVKLAVGGTSGPATQNDAYSTPEDQRLNVAAPGVLANDGTGPLTAELVSPVTTGTLTLNPNGSFSFDPPADFNGTATFQYRAVAGTIPGTVATVTITVTPVNDAPVANPDSATAVSGATIQIAVLANDTDIDDPASALRVQSVTQGTNGGSVAIDSSGTLVTYTSAPGFSGQETFTYTARDAAGAVSAPATVTVTVQANQAPVGVPDTATTTEDTPVVIDVLANDSDPNGDTVTIASVSTTSANGGTVTQNGQMVTYTPASNFSGTDSFTYHVTDGSLSSGPVAVTVTVTAVNDAPVAANDLVAVTRHGTFVLPAPGVLGNDSDPDGQALTATLVTGLNLGKGTLALGADGSVSYTPPAEFVGNQTFTYRASDGTANSPAATVTLAKDLTVKKAIYTDRPGTTQDSWVIDGKATAAAGSQVTIYVGGTPGGTIIATVPIVNGAWKYERKGALVPPDATRLISVQSNNGSILTDIPVTVR